MGKISLKNIEMLGYQITWFFWSIEIHPQDPKKGNVSSWLSNHIQYHKYSTTRLKKYNFTYIRDDFMR